MAEEDKAFKKKDKKKKKSSMKEPEKTGTDKEQLDEGASKGKKAPEAKKGPEAKKKRDLGVPAALLIGKKDKKKEDVPPPLLCPDCGAELKEGMKKCPECGTALAEGEEIVCAVCGAVVDQTVGVCLICGTKFISKDSAGTSTDLPIEDFAHRTRKRPRPAVKIGTDEKKVEKGPDVKKVEEPVKKKPKKKAPPKEPIRRPRPKKGIMSSPVMFPAMVCLLLVIAALAVHFSPMTKGIVIDGEFKDWDDVVMHEDEPDPSVPEAIDIVSYAVTTEDGKVNLYMSTEGNMFQGTMMTATYVNMFVDADRDPTTGYLIESIGAEYRLEVKGWDGKAQSAKYFTFKQAGDPKDWMDFTETGNIEASSSGKELEVAKTLSTFQMKKDSTPAILFTIRSSDGGFDASQAPVGLRPGGMAITQYLKMPSTPVQRNSTDLVVMTIKLEAKGKDDTISMLKLTRLGTGTVGDVSKVALYSSDTKVDDGKFTEVGDRQQLTLEPHLLVKVGKPVVLTVKMDIWEKAPGRTLGAMLLSTKDVSLERSPAVLHTFQDDAKVTYINNTPDSPRVDGAFGDWTDTNSDRRTVTGNPAHPNVDVVSMRTKLVKEGHLKLFVEVSGEALGGHQVPEYGSNVSCGPSPSCPNTGEDIFIIYMDADSDQATGHQLGGLGIEYAVIVQGKYGEVNWDSLGFYDWDSGKSVWEKLSKDGVTAYTDLHRAEIEIDFSKSGLQSLGGDYTYMVELKDQTYTSVTSPTIHA